jgi:hypothetical protein
MQKGTAVTSQTQELIRQLGALTWFSAVGQPLPAELARTSFPVRSWSEAVLCCKSLEWENYSLERRNSLTMYLHRHAKQRYQQWNELVDSVKSVVVPLVHAKLAGMPRELDEVKATVNWDVLGACMELEFADVREPEFFVGLMSLYGAGHFPCGWGERDYQGVIHTYGPVEKMEDDADEADLTRLALSAQERLFRPTVVWPTAGKLLVY